MTEGTQHRARVTYLLGAGASYGQTKLDENNKEVRASGVPVVNQFASEITSCIEYLKDFNVREDFKEDLEWLYQKCKRYPTIDTFARQLSITGKYKESRGLNELKNILTAFLTLEQIRYPYDYRYDGFIASIIKNNGTFPPVNILSWNYDCQFEMAYKEYTEISYIYHLWKRLGVHNKMFKISDAQDNTLKMFKLNGTAHYLYKDKFESEDNALQDVVLSRNFDLVEDDFDNQRRLISYAIKCWDNARFGNYKTCLSFAWEGVNNASNRENDILAELTPVLENTEVLVVIGYSFPRVNREVDQAIIQKCRNLRKVYIQDPRANEIVNNFKSIFTYTGDVIPNTDTLMFYIPNEL